MQWKPGLILRIKDYKFEDDGSFIFFQANVRKESYEKFEKASRALWGVVSLGMLTNEELARIIKCALKSKFIPLNIMSELSAFKETL